MTIKLIRKLPEFAKDFKKLLKKYKSLEEDIETFEDTSLKMYHILKIATDGIIRIDNLGINYPHIYKVKKFRMQIPKRHWQ